jgi:hypothetical protein
VEEFMELLIQMKSDYHEGKNQKEVMDVEVSFRDFVNDWFYRHYKVAVGTATFKSLKIYIEKLVVPYFGDKIISKITNEDIIYFYCNLEI